MPSIRTRRQSPHPQPISREDQDFLRAYRTLPEQIAANLGKQILEGHIRPGSPLIETELAAMIGTSRGPIRDAIALLSRDGLVAKVPNRRAFAISLNERTLREAVSLRACLELFASELAITAMGDQDVARLGNLSEKMGQAAYENDRSTFNQLDFDFHDCLMRGSGHQALYESWRSIRHRIRLFVASTNQVGADLARVAKQNREIFEALRARNGKALRRAVKAHFKAVDRDLTKFLKTLSKGSDETNVNGFDSTHVDSSTSAPRVKRNGR